MVNARTVSTVLALSCVAAPLLRATCNEGEEFQSVLDHSNNGYVGFPDAEANTATNGMEENLMSVDDAEEEEPAEGEVEEVQEDDSAAEEDFEAAVPPETGGFLENQRKHAEPVPVVETQDKIKERPNPEPAYEPEPKPVGEADYVPATPKGVAAEEEEEEAPLGFFGKVRKSLSKGFHSLKAKFSKAP